MNLIREEPIKAQIQSGANTGRKRPTWQMLIPNLKRAAWATSNRGENAGKNHLSILLPGLLQRHGRENPAGQRLGFTVHVQGDVFFARTDPFSAGPIPISPFKACGLGGGMKWKALNISRLKIRTWRLPMRIAIEFFMMKLRPEIEQFTASARPF